MKNSILAELFGKLDIAVMEIVDNGNFRLMGVVPNWFAELFRESMSGGMVSGIEECSPFLENFLIDAEEFWSRTENGLLRSGSWIEVSPSGNEYALEAIATRSGEMKVLLVELTRYSYDEKHGILQRGRELSLDHDELERQVAERTTQLRNAFDQLSALYDISRELNSVRDINELLKSLVQKIKNLLNVEFVAVFLWDPDRDSLFSPIPQEPSINRSITSQVAQWVFNESKPILIKDVKEDKRFLIDDIDDNESTGSTTLVDSILCVPLRSRENIIGVIESINKREGYFTEEDQNLLNAMADNIAVSIEKEKLYEDLKTAEMLLRRQNASLRQSVKKKYRFDSIIGNSNKLMDVIKRAEQVALTDSTILIYGETGTGKELLAHAIHQISHRSQKNFVPINCGAIPENLLESELFGHEKGAFTGAIARRIGRFEEANGGTLFLDEIGDMSAQLQIRLLRVLQDGIILRLGSNVDVNVDVRVIAATHQNLAQLVKKEKFRRDLYYRLRVFELEIPPLRERKEDIPLLVNHFIKRYSDKMGIGHVEIEDDAIDFLCSRDYPGNIRELEHIIESAVILFGKKGIKANDLRREMNISAVSGGIPTIDGIPITIPRNNEELKTAKAEVHQNLEYIFLTELLSSTGGKVSEAAKKSGINRTRLSQLISRHNLNIQQFRNIVTNK